MTIRPRFGGSIPSEPLAKKPRLNPLSDRISTFLNDLFQLSQNASHLDDLYMTAEPLIRSLKENSISVEEQRKVCQIFFKSFAQPKEVLRRLETWLINQHKLRRREGNKSIFPYLEELKEVVRNFAGQPDVFNFLEGFNCKYAMVFENVSITIIATPIFSNWEHPFFHPDASGLICKFLHCDPNDVLVYSKVSKSCLRAAQNLLVGEGSRLKSREYHLGAISGLFCLADPGLLTFSNLKQLSFKGISKSKDEHKKTLNNIFKFQNIEKLSFRTPYISRLESLVKLTNLKSLNLARSHLRSFIFLKKLTQLDALHLDFCKIDKKDAEGSEVISQLTNLTHLSIRGMGTEVNEFMRHLPNLVKTLDLSGSNASFASNDFHNRSWTSINMLNLEGCWKFEDMNFIGLFPNLSTLNISMCANLKNSIQYLHQIRYKGSVIFSDKISLQGTFCDGFFQGTYNIGEIKFESIDGGMFVNFKLQGEGMRTHKGISIIGVFKDSHAIFGNRYELTDSSNPKEVYRGELYTPNYPSLGTLEVEFNNKKYTLQGEFQQGRENQLYCRGTLFLERGNHMQEMAKGIFVKVRPGSLPALLPFQTIDEAILSTS